MSYADIFLCMDKETQAFRILTRELFIEGSFVKGLRECVDVLRDVTVNFV